MTKYHDNAYYQAGEWACDDYWLLNINRTDKEVEQETERIRKREGK
jgi:hypothetical protein